MNSFSNILYLYNVDIVVCVDVNWGTHTCMDICTLAYMCSLYTCGWKLNFTGHWNLGTTAVFPRKHFHTCKANWFISLLVQILSSTCRARSFAFPDRESDSTSVIKTISGSTKRLNFRFLEISKAKRMYYTFTTYKRHKKTVWEQI